MADNQLILTSPFGKFIFPEDTVLAHAKLIRDTVTGQAFSPKSTGAHRNTVHIINTDMDAYRYTQTFGELDIIRRTPYMVVVSTEFRSERRARIHLSAA